MRGWWGNYDIFIYFCGGTKQEHIYILSDVYLKYSIKQLLGGKSTIALLKTHSQAIRAVTLYEPLKSLRAMQRYTVFRHFRCAVGFSESRFYR